MKVDGAAARKLSGWRIARPLLLGLALIAGAGACTTDKKLREAELGSIEHWLPGVYDNSLQIEDQAAAGQPVHEPVDLVIVRVSSMMIGKMVFYEQQLDSRNPRRILRQRLHRFEAAEDGAHITHSILSLREPGRWTTGHRHAEIFKSLMPDDVAPGNCPLHWKREEGVFVGTNPGPCRATTPAGRPANLQTRMELTETELRIAEKLLDSSGAPIEGGAQDSVLKLVKKAG